MKIGLLQCDKVSSVFESEHGQYPEMFARLLRQADPCLEWTVFDAEQGELPQDIHAVDAYLITGSRHGVNDGFGWITQLEEFIRVLHMEKKKVIGICFGHQLIAKALGGTVIKSPKGWGVGVSVNRLFSKQSWMSPEKNELNVLVSHQDQVIKVPKEAQILAGSEFCPYYMMQIGTHFLTVQGHPEFSKAYSRILMVSREDRINKKEFERGMVSLALGVDETLMAQWIINFLKAVHPQSYLE